MAFKDNAELEERVAVVAQSSHKSVKGGRRLLLQPLWLLVTVMAVWIWCTGKPLAKFLEVTAKAVEDAEKT